MLYNITLLFYCHSKIKVPTKVWMKMPLSNIIMVPAYFSILCVSCGPFNNTTSHLTFDLLTQTAGTAMTPLPLSPRGPLSPSFWPQVRSHWSWTTQQMYFLELVISSTNIECFVWVNSFWICSIECCWKRKKKKMVCLIVECLYLLDQACMSVNSNNVFFLWMSR